MTAPRILKVDEIASRWAEILPLLASINRPKRYWCVTPGEAFEHFYRGHWTLWVEGDPVTALCAAGVLKERDGSLSLTLELVAGKADWPAALEPIEAWGRERGCVRTVMPRARAGWLSRSYAFRKRFRVKAYYAEAPL
jgi:hypothetical protein